MVSTIISVSISAAPDGLVIIAYEEGVTQLYQFQGPKTLTAVRRWPGLKLKSTLPRNPVVSATGQPKSSHNVLAPLGAHKIAAAHVPAFPEHLPPAINSPFDLFMLSCQDCLKRRSPAIYDILSADCSIIFLRLPSPSSSGM